MVPQARSSSPNNSNSSYNVPPTFVTGLDIEEVTDETTLVHSGRQSSVVAAEARTLEEAIARLPPMVGYGEVDLPPKIRMSAIMALAGDAIAFETKHQKELWYKYFYSKPSEKIIRDSYWYVLIDFFATGTKKDSRPITAAPQLGENEKKESKVSTIRPSSVPNHSSSKLVQATPPVNPIITKLKERIAQNYVTLFLNIEAKEKDNFLKFYYDGLAQSIFYAISVAYPDSRGEVDTPQFKARFPATTPC